MPSRGFALKEESTKDMTWPLSFAVSEPRPKHEPITHVERQKNARGGNLNDVNLTHFFITRKGKSLIQAHSHTLFYHPQGQIFNWSTLELKHIKPNTPLAHIIIRSPNHNPIPNLETHSNHTTYTMIVFVCNISWWHDSKSDSNNWILKKGSKRLWKYIL